MVFREVCRHVPEKMIEAVESSVWFLEILVSVLPLAGLSVISILYCRGLIFLHFLTFRNDVVSRKYASCFC